eukprot:6669672-Pyramimonas_sp.AAC.1
MKGHIPKRDQDTTRRNITWQSHYNTGHGRTLQIIPYHIMTGQHNIVHVTRHNRTGYART